MSAIILLYAVLFLLIILFIGIAWAYRASMQEEFRRNREELQASLKLFNDSLIRSMTDISTLQKNQLDSFSKQLSLLTQTHDQKMDVMRQTLENRLHLLQEDNGKKLELMRLTVDEKLHATLEKRLGDSFQLVSQRLELVHKGLGEMQSLASGVGDLKRVLTNVKTRGIWGEIQLGNLLDQILTPEQYLVNTKVNPQRNETVEFAIKLKDCLLPIDSKYPQESYQRLLAAQDSVDSEGVALAKKELETTIKSEAKDIFDKYLCPPFTTDFGILFLPIEGLYAEVLRLPGLTDVLQQKFRVVVAGPTTLAAILNGLQMGFRAMAIQQRASEVWSVLGAVKTEFGKFGDILDKTQKKLQEAGNTIEDASRKSRTIERQLRNVQELPTQDSVLKELL